MGAETNIEWTGSTWNPIAAFTKHDLWVIPGAVSRTPIEGWKFIPKGTRGWFCTKVSPGCAHCYAEGINIRLGNGLSYIIRNLEHIEFRLVNLEAPLRWQKPRRIFVNSMTDLFHEAIPMSMIAQVFAIMALANRHTFQVLTKRSNMEDFRTEKGLTEIQTVARWLTKNRLSYGGIGTSFGWEGARASREAILAALRELSERLDRTIIESLPYEQCIRHYDKPDTFFFLDPPYLDADPGVYDGWVEDQMREFAQVVAAIRGKWLITVNDSSVTRAIFKGYRLRSTALDNKLASARLKKKVIMRELLITAK
jgi:site-specific DNA-adenine methylase